jgi:hypothetical protein
MVMRTSDAHAEVAASPDSCLSRRCVGFELRAGGVLGVAHEVPIVAVDDLHARSHEACEFEHGDIRRERPRGERVSEVVDPVGARPARAAWLLAAVLAPQPLRHVVF